MPDSTVGGNAQGGPLIEGQFQLWLVDRVRSSFCFALDADQITNETGHAICRLAPFLALAGVLFPMPAESIAAHASWESLDAQGSQPRAAHVPRPSSDRLDG